jgi:capsular polysaccharide biosynthesis protein
VFIRRKPSERRVIENEPEVLNSLELAGFTGIYMEDYSFADQIKIAVESKIIVGLHGAGMVNCMFMQKGSCVLELMNPDFMNPELFQLCNILGIQYDYFCGEARGDIQPCFQNVLIDVNALIVAVERTTKTSFD